MQRLTLDELRRLEVERYPRLVASIRPNRGWQRPREREETEVLIELARADWRRFLAEGRGRWLSDGRLELTPGILPPPAR